MVFRYVGISKVPSYNKYLVETGVFGRLWEELYIRLNLGRKPATNHSVRRYKQPKESDISLGLDVAIQTFFVVWITAVSLALLSFGFEVRYRIYQWLWLIVLSINTLSLKLWRRKCLRRMKNWLGGNVGMK